MKPLERLIPRSTAPGLRGFVVFCLMLLVPLFDAAAGVLVAPTIVFISSKQRTGRLTVQNPTDTPKEITIRFSFGLPVSDSLGQVHIALQDSAVTDPHSALGWVKAFPRKLILPPSGEQIIRFVASPPADLPEGEYWARIVVQSREAETAVPPASEEGIITTRLNMVMQTAMMLKFRKGNLVSQLEVTGMEVRRDSGNVEVTVDMTSQGNASYVGLLNCRLLDADNRELSSQSVQLAVYYSLRRRVFLPVTGSDFKEPYHVELAISTRGRTDIAAEDMIHGNNIMLTQTPE
ncbi:MAG TPA: hypothetical protein VMY05_02960 [Acidobacteriota bacterium]|nr:hypothetical protein [Acidobacteriota bacterium]